MIASRHALRSIASGSPARSLALLLLLAACGVDGIDASAVAPISNDDTYATLGYLWSGVQSSIQREREPSTDTFSLPLSYQLPCTRGSGAYQGTLAGTKANGSGNATLSLTATLAECEFVDTRSVTRISASGVLVTGTVAIVNDAWDAINLHMVATTVTVNGVACPGGVDVILTGTSPSARPVSTGTACGRTGAVALP
jgi:hypothetical protein